MKDPVSVGNVKPVDDSSAPSLRNTTSRISSSSESPGFRIGGSPASARTENSISKDEELPGSGLNSIGVTCTKVLMLYCNTPALTDHPAEDSSQALRSLKFSTSVMRCLAQ